MPAPSKLSIATSSLVRLYKEDISYHKELAQQEARVKQLESEQGEDEDSNLQYQLKQERKAVEETKAIFPALQKRISQHANQLEQLLSDDASTASESPEAMAKAKEALANAKTS